MGEGGRPQGSRIRLVEGDPSPGCGGRPRPRGVGISELKQICARQLMRSLPSSESWSVGRRGTPGAQTPAVTREVGGRAFVPKGTRGPPARDGP